MDNQLTKIIAVHSGYKGESKHILAFYHSGADIASRRIWHCPPLKCLRLSKRLGEKKMTTSFLNVDILILIVKQLFQELSTSEITSTIFHLHSVLPTEFSFEAKWHTRLRSCKIWHLFYKPSTCEFFCSISKMCLSLRGRIRGGGACLSFTSGLRAVHFSTFRIFQWYGVGFDFIVQVLILQWDNLPVLA